ncbi:MAG: MGMT family protein [Ignavibacteria bacterium]|nr:MGMT family protein [Ignavibacteria bacterium]
MAIRKSKIVMSKSRNNFFDKVYEVTAKIPYGKVTTYGHIARFCGSKSSARTVGWALNGAKDTGLPCHRVVNRFGALTGRIHFGDPKLMEDMLRAEGVEFDNQGCVIMEEFLWDPNIQLNKMKQTKRKVKRN